MEHDNLFYWKHYSKYKRSTAEDLKNEPTLVLLEIIAADIMQEKKEIERVLRKNPNNEAFISHANRLKEDFETEFFECISFGYRDEILRSFIKNCPKGVFENGRDGKGKDDNLAQSTRFYIEANEQDLKRRRYSSWNGGERSSHPSEHSKANYKRISPNGRRMHIPRSKDT